MTIPTFMIIGVAKAGTTSLYRYLDQHPQVFMCPVKGTNYFGYEDACDWKWTDEGEPPALHNFQVTTFEAYEAMFAGVSDEVAVGEASPQYIRCPTAAKRIYHCMPHMKLVVSLRNPADRAFSGFLMRTRRGEIVADIYEELTPQSSHVREGFYYRRLKRFFDLFPGDQIKIIIFEEFKTDPAATVVDLFEFIGVDTAYRPDTSTRHNPAAVPRNRLLNRLFYSRTLIRTANTVLPEGMRQMAKRIRQQNLMQPPEFPVDLRASLLDHYRDDILKLETLIGRDLSVWFEPA